MPSKTTTKAPPEPQITVEIITPQTAEEWLTKNTHNRDIRWVRVEEYAGRITRGEWMLNGDAFKFDYNGVLIDGQHRLWAVVSADAPIQSLVIRGLPPESQDTMDQNIHRNLKDALKLRGEKNASHLAAVISAKWRWDNGYIRQIQRTPSVPQAMDVLSKHPDLREATKKVGNLRSRFRVSSGMGAIWYELMTIDFEAAEEFWESLITGVNLVNGSPILALRRWLERQSAAGTGARTSTVMTQAMFVKAWNAWRQGLDVDHLLWRPTGQRAEPFPIPVA